MKKIRIYAVIEVFSVYFLLELSAFLFSLTCISQIQRDLLYWNYIITILFAAVPVLGLLLFKRNFRSYGFQFKNAKVDIIWALFIVFLIILPSIPTLIFGIATFDLAKHQPQYFISTLIFQLVFTGICEEIFFRGLINCSSKLGQIWTMARNRQWLRRCHYLAGTSSTRNSIGSGTL
jgi:membrane protease YdiL (CAAX protease family)